jgi:Methyltransferase domain
VSVNASWFRMFLEMRRRSCFTTGDVLALGVQDVMFTHETAAELLNERRVEFTTLPVDQRAYHLSRNQRQFTCDPRHYTSIKDLFEMLRYRLLETLDAFDNDAPDLLWNLCEPIPKEWHNRYDLVFDIGVLEHTADIFQALENVGNLVKPGGWIALYLPMVSPINSCLYHPNPPFYYDILTANGFANLSAWINWMPDWDQQNDIRTIWLNYRYNDDVYIWRPRYYTVMLCLAQKHDHLGSFKPVLQNFYQHWHAELNPFPASAEEILRPDAAGLSEAGSIGSAQATRSEFARAVLAALSQRQGGPGTSPWLHPTAMSKPSAAQIARFPLNKHGVPYAPECLSLPVDSQLQRDIPEQMLVGEPAREQLYL